jgi:hypothetical protein
MRKPHLAGVALPLSWSTPIRSRADILASSRHSNQAARQGILRTERQSLIDVGRDISTWVVAAVTSSSSTCLDWLARATSRPSAAARASGILTGAEARARAGRPSLDGVASSAAVRVSWSQRNMPPV